MLFLLPNELWKNSRNKIWKLLCETNCILARTTIKRISTYYLWTCLFKSFLENQTDLYFETISKGFGVLILMYRERSGKAKLQGIELAAKQLREFPNLQTACLGCRFGLTWWFGRKLKYLKKECRLCMKIKNKKQNKKLILLLQWAHKMKDEDLWYEEKALLQYAGGKPYWEDKSSPRTCMCVTCCVDRAGNHTSKLISYLQIIRWNFSELP